MPSLLQSDFVRMASALRDGSYQGMPSGMPFDTRDVGSALAAAVSAENSSG
jgi:hypothetical protein